ncbi:hypothetical protein LXL04_015626 [Taraxacum kok-saghyz]
MCTSRSSSTQKNPTSNWKHNQRFIGDCRLYHRTMRRRPGIGGLQTIAAARAVRPCLRASTGFLSHGCMTHICTAVPLLEARLRWRETDLSRNYLNGTIRPQWAPMRLGDLSLMGNRLSGPFPRVLTRITTLVNLCFINIVLKHRRKSFFRIHTPRDCKHEESAETFHIHSILASNEFSGQLSDGLGKLTNLTDMRLSDNNFTGKIPDYISNWTQIEKLHMQGCYLEGPIPSSISLLTKLNELRISDLKGTGSSFPRLQKMDDLSKLVLRNCLINGTIHDYLGNMRTLKTLDLSFNNLTGKIPSSFSELGKTDYIYVLITVLLGVLLVQLNVHVGQCKQGASGSDIVEALTANNILQEKYGLKKQKKYAPKVLLRRPFA